MMMHDEDVMTFIQGCADIFKNMVKADCSESDIGGIPTAMTISVPRLLPNKHFFEKVGVAGPGFVELTGDVAEKTQATGESRSG
eukprot:7451663-Karenia_brevis.AAC.1